MVPARFARIPPEKYSHGIASEQAVTFTMRDFRRPTSRSRIVRPLAPPSIALCGSPASELVDVMPGPPVQLQVCALCRRSMKVVPASRL